MRKQIIKFFALDYKVFIFGRLISWTRSANIIFPLMLLSGYLTLIENPLKIPAYILLAVATFFGFFYFLIKPIKQTDYDYFDEVQKFMWDYKNNRELNEPEKWNNPLLFWVNPLAVLLFVLFYFL